MNYQLASAILKNKWAIELQFAMNSAGLVADILAGNVEVQQQAEEYDKPIALTLDSKHRSSSNEGYTYWDWDNAPENSIALIKLQGSLMKNNQSCGPIGMAAIGERIKEADKNPNFSGILLLIDSPGGTVDGTQTLAEIVKSTQKPIVAFVDGLMASAALWVGTSADEVWASTGDDEIGSVGVLMNFMDIQPYWESLGVKFHTVTASQSTEKVKMWKDLREGKYEEYRKEFLDPIAQTFIDAVKENRPDVKDEHLTGKVYLAKNSTGIFIDSIGRFEDAIERVYQLSENNITANASNGSQTADNNQIVKTMKYSKIQKALGLSDESFVAEADGRRTFTTEEMEAVENSLGEDNSSDLQSQLDTANSNLSERDTTVTELESQVETANSTITERDATIGQLNQQISDLKGEAADPGAKVHKKSDGGSSIKTGKAVSEKYDNPFDALDEVSKEYLGKSVNE